MNSLHTRILSALVAIALIFCLVFFYQDTGLRVLCYLASALGARELMRILFKREDSLTIKALFFAYTLLIFYATLEYPGLGTVTFACLSILFLSFSLLLEKRFTDLTTLSLFQAKAILGFFYIGILPALAGRILDLENGSIWFATMLGVVFAGDTFAYAFGLLWGQRKLLPNISPKKTVIGSAGGLLGSVSIAVAAGHWLPGIPTWGLILLGLGTGLVAQLGDLFESMLKRVANIKDSGRLMPGHGGILDRIDGVLFGAPIFLFISTVLETHF